MQNELKLYLLVCPNTCLWKTCNTVMILIGFVDVVFYTKIYSNCSVYCGLYRHCEKRFMFLIF